jgi:biotin carboxylase
MKKKNIFVVGLDDFNLTLLRSVRHADDYAFHSLLEYSEIAGALRFDMERLLDKARSQLRAFSGSIDAIVGFWDFPTILMIPILRREFGLRGPTLESVLRCEHKYWSRLEQMKVAPEIIPGFALVDPFDDRAAEKVDLKFPFWIKPVKAHSSLLGYRIRNRCDLDHALSEIRKGIYRFAEPFDVIMSYAHLPDEIAKVDGSKCIAEEIISAGRQCTLEGYVFEGDAEVYGIVDSIRGPNRSSFERYEYPSSLPRPVQRRMKALARKVIGFLGLDDSPFNLEFFYEEARDRLSLLEINARISKSHSPLFDKVEGVPHNEVMIDVALGKRPDFPAGHRRFRHAAKFMPRLYGNHERERVAKAPDEDELRAIEARFPGAEIQLHVHEGMRLADLMHRDAYSYELAAIFIGASSRPALMRDFKAIFRALDLRFKTENAATQPAAAE